LYKRSVHIYKPGRYVLGLFREVLPVTGSGSRLEATAMARRQPNILDSFNSTAPAKRILRDEGPELQ